MKKTSPLGKLKQFLVILFTFAILVKISNYYRPSQIAEQLRVTEQAIHYHIERMIDANLMYKDTTNGIRWKLTEKDGLIVVMGLKNLRPMILTTPTIT
jgi:predicted transcriptional regulator